MQQHGITCGLNGRPALSVPEQQKVSRHIFRSDKFLGYSATGREKVSSTDFVRDAVQGRWVQLLEDARAEGDASRDGARANSAGRSAGRDIIREQRRYVLLPEEETDPETGESTSAAPWNQTDPSDYYRENFADDVRRVLRAVEHQHQRGVLLRLRDERPDDYEFLITYLAGRRRSRFTRKERSHSGDSNRTESCP